MYRGASRSSKPISKISFFFVFNFVLKYCQIGFWFSSNQILISGGLVFNLLFVLLWRGGGNFRPLAVGFDQQNIRTDLILISLGLELSNVLRIICEENFKVYVMLSHSNLEKLPPKSININSNFLDILKFIKTQNKFLLNF